MLSKIEPFCDKDLHSKAGMMQRLHMKQGLEGPKQKETDRDMFKELLGIL